MDIKHTSFSVLLAPEAPHVRYYVPKYQRPYSWSKENVNDLLHDAQENVPGHFIGTIIYISDARADANKNFEVIDGQQRLTTLALFLAAMYKKLNNKEIEKGLSEDDLQELNHFRFNIKQRLVKKIAASSSEGEEKDAFQWGDGKYFLRVQPSTQKNNLYDFKYVLSQAGILPSIGREGAPKNFGKRMMAKAYKIFLEETPQDWPEIKGLLEKINSLEVIQIAVGEHQDAYRLFETLNDRGAPLTPVDIIKNKMLAKLDRTKQLNIDDAYEKWKAVSDNLNENDSRFLRQYQDAFGPEKRKRTTASELIKIYGERIDRDDSGQDALSLLNDLGNKSRVYRQLISPEEDGIAAKELIELQHIGAAPSYTLLMFLLSNIESIEGGEKTFSEILVFLQKYYLRRNVTDTPNTKHLDQIQIDVIEGCKESLNSGGKITCEKIVEKMTKHSHRPASRSLFRERLEGDLYYQNRAMARYILIKIAESAQNRESQFQLWENKPGTATPLWTIEHILPAGDKIPGCWVKMIADGDKELAEEIWLDWVDCLGNLTLTAYNSKLSNDAFEKKQKKSEIAVGGVKRSIGYKNGLYLNDFPFLIDGKEQTLATIEKWTQESIEARNKAMVDWVCKEFRLSDEKDES